MAENNFSDQGISYLIDILNSSNGQEQGISAYQFAGALRQGIITEPGRFEELVEALANRIGRAYPDWSPEKTKLRALENITIYSLMADHDYKREILPRIVLGDRKVIEKYLDNPNEYGPAMKALSAYTRMEGPALRKFILEKQEITN